MIGSAKQLLGKSGDIAQSSYFSFDKNADPITNLFYLMQVMR